MNSFYYYGQYTLTGHHTSMGVLVCLPNTARFICTLTINHFQKYCRHWSPFVFSIKITSNNIHTVTNTNMAYLYSKKKQFLDWNSDTETCHMSGLSITVIETLLRLNFSAELNLFWTRAWPTLAWWGECLHGCLGNKSLSLIYKPTVRTNRLFIFCVSEKKYIMKYIIYYNKYEII